jgi:hypothetical protein
MSNEWINGTEARRILQVSNTRLLRLAVLGRVRTRLEPGFAVQYNRADVEKVAGERSQLQVA